MRNRKIRLAVAITAAVIMAVVLSAWVLNSQMLQIWR